MVLDSTNIKLLATSDKTKQTTARNDQIVYLYLYVEVNLCSKYSSLLIGGYLKRCPISKSMRYNNRPKKKKYSDIIRRGPWWICLAATTFHACNHHIWAWPNKESHLIHERNLYKIYLQLVNIFSIYLSSVIKF